MTSNSENALSHKQHNILVAEDLRKSYGHRKALQGLSFTLESGRVMGFLGPNGAGKTTSIRILTTMLEPDGGSFSIDGIGCENPEEIRRRIGVLPENLGFPRHMTGIEYLTYFGQLYGQGPKTARANAEALLNEVGMQQRARSLIGTYSHGMRQRIGIARALVNEPVVVFLDEPTLGLDPRGQQELLALVRLIAEQRGTGVVLCSHLLSEIEGVCDDVIILSGGQIVARGPVKQVIRQVQSSVTRVRLPPERVAEAQELLEQLPFVQRTTQTAQMGGWLGIELEGSDEIPADDFHLCNQVLAVLIRAEIPILAFESEGGRLQDVFLQLTQEGIR